MTLRKVSFSAFALSEMKLNTSAKNASAKNGFDVFFM
jgi:hypothetical protein